MCGNHVAHQLTKQSRKFSLFFIPLFSVGTKYLDTVPLVAGSSRSAGSRQRQQPGRSARSCGDSAKPFTSAPGQLTNGLVDGSHDHLTGPAYVRRNPSLNGDQSRQRFPVGNTRGESQRAMVGIRVPRGPEIAAAVTDNGDDGQGFGARTAWLYVTLLSIGYMISR
jgi:hypothetical protein